MMMLSPRLRQILRLAGPTAVRREAARIVQKWLRRLRKSEHRVISLAPGGRPRGKVLVSYILDPFLLPAGRPLPHGHTHHWESRQIARTFLDLGYAVDAISWKNTAFEPREVYRAVVDVRINLERWAPHLPPSCIKIMHGETAHWRFHNPAQEERLRALTDRRGIVVRPQKMIEPNRAIESADCATVLGNEFTLGTFAFAGKPLYPIPISTPFTYPELARDMTACRRSFLWFGSGGMVHKGLDRVLEVFAALPDYHLTVCGPIHLERDFERAYYRELYDLPNIHTYGWIDVASDDFLKIARESLALIYPSCSEGQCGGVVTCMHAGLVPIISAQTGLTLDAATGVTLPDCEIDTIRTTLIELASRPAGELSSLSRRSREHALRHHTRECFAAEYRRAVEEILSTFEVAP